MAAALRYLCLAFAVLLGAFAVPAHAAGDGGCCASHAANSDEAAQIEAGEFVSVEAADHGCGCGAACCCTKTVPVRGCDCTKSPAPAPQPAEPSLPKPPSISDAAARVLRVQQVAPDLTTAAKLRAATASGLPHVLLPGRSRQIALSIWRC